MSPNGEAAHSGVSDASDVGPVETAIVAGMARHFAWILPAGILVGFLVAGGRGAAGVAVGLTLALGNFGLSAFILQRAASVSLPAIQAGALFGFLLRLVLLGVALFLLRRVGVFHFPSLGLALCLGHLALMTVEARYLTRAMSLAGDR